MPLGAAVSGCWLDAGARVDKDDLAGLDLKEGPARWRERANSCHSRTMTPIFPVGRKPFPKPKDCGDGASPKVPGAAGPPSPALLSGLPRPRPQGNMGQDLIADQDTGKNVAIMRGGEVFRDDGEGTRIAIVLNDYFMILMAFWSAI
jgi:hypothetical protein